MRESKATILILSEFAENLMNLVVLFVKIEGAFENFNAECHYKFTDGTGSKIISDIIY